MTSSYGGHVRRTTAAANDLLLDDALDIDPSDDDLAGAGGDGPEGPADLSGEAGEAGELDQGDRRIVQPPPPPLGPLDLSPPPPPPAREDGGRLGAMIPVLLAALGLAAAVIAWRAGVAASAADDATRAGIDAGRERAATVIGSEGLTARATEAYLDYERARQRAEALTKAGVNDQALLNRMEATSHWFLVRPEYLDRNGQFQPAQERAALLADAEQTKDIQPLAHFTVADAEYGRLQGLIRSGIVIAIALPFLTLAEIARGRLRLSGVIVGSGIFGLGLVLAVIAWL